MVSGGKVSQGSWALVVGIATWRTTKGASNPDEWTSCLASPVKLLGRNGSGFVHLPAEMQKQMLGEKLYPMVAKYQPELAARWVVKGEWHVWSFQWNQLGDVSEAGKITGMMLEMDNNELMRLLESKAQQFHHVDQKWLEMIRKQSELHGVLEIPVKSQNNVGGDKLVGFWSYFTIKDSRICQKLSISHAHVCFFHAPLLPSSEQQVRNKVDEAGDLCHRNGYRIPQNPHSFQQHAFDSDYRLCVWSNKLAVTIERLGRGCRHRKFQR